MDDLQFRERVAQVDDGELTYSAADYTVIFPPADVRKFVFLTKRSTSLRLLLSDKDEPVVGVIGRYGLPRDADVVGISSIVQCCDLFFLGDCDPYDLLTFAWLRRHFPIRFLGVSDAAMAALGVIHQSAITIRLPNDELQALTLLREVCPEYRDLVGPSCAELLDSGSKIELEALVSFRTMPVSNLHALIDSQS